MVMTRSFAAKLCLIDASNAFKKNNLNHTINGDETRNITAKLCLHVVKNAPKEIVEHHYEI